MATTPTPEPTRTDFQAWVDDGEGVGHIRIDGRLFSVTPDLAFGVIALLMEINRLNEHLAELAGADQPTSPLVNAPNFNPNPPPTTDRTETP